MPSYDVAGNLWQAFGAGGRMRDTHATGIGSLLTAGTSGYCVGNLRIPGEEMAHEAGGLLRTSTRPTLSLLFLLRASGGLLTTSTRPSLSLLLLLLLRASA